MDLTEIETKHGAGGYWCQGDAVFVPGEHPTVAIDTYRYRLANGVIGISSELSCVDAYRVKRFQSALDSIRIQVGILQRSPEPDQAQAALQQILKILSETGFHEQESSL